MTIQIINTTTNEVVNTLTMSEWEASLDGGALDQFISGNHTLECSVQNWNSNATGFRAEVVEVA